MTTENGMGLDQKSKLRSLLIKHEGDKDYPYMDTFGNITIGIGRNLTGIGIREDEKDLMFKNDTDFLFDYLSKTYHWFLELNEPRQIAIIDMAFMGIKHFETFEKLIDALSMHDYTRACSEILDSEYGKKFHNRASDISQIILNGFL